MACLHVRCFLYSFIQLISHIGPNIIIQILIFFAVIIFFFISHFKEFILFLCRQANALICVLVKLTFVAVIFVAVFLCLFICTQCTFVD